jgi:cytochrome d ubiquinol oxidase subunit I
MMVLMEGAYLRTQEKMYEQLARFWTRIFAITFGIGVATGIVMEFEFGANWATYSRYVGDVFGSTLVITYTAFVYKTFWGKVKMDETSY